MKTKLVDCQDKYRPQYHFTPKNNWMNDPNGLVYLKNILEKSLVFGNAQTYLNYQLRVIPTTRNGFFWLVTEINRLEDMVPERNILWRFRRPYFYEEWIGSKSKMA